MYYVICILNRSVLSSFNILLLLFTFDKHMCIKQADHPLDEIKK